MTLALVALAALAGLIAVLKVVASKTKTQVDDEILAVAEKAEPVLEDLVQK